MKTHLLLLCALPLISAAAPMRHGPSTTSTPHPAAAKPTATCPTPGANCPAVGANGTGQCINAGQARGFGRGHGMGAGNGAGRACSLALPAGVVTTLPADRLIAAIEEERVAHDLYAVAAAKTGIRAFTQIGASETRHAEALTQLAATAEVVPASATPGAYISPDMQHLYDSLLPLMSQSDTSALNAGALVEESDIADLRRLLATDIDDTTKAVLTSLESASRHHLLAFVRNLSARGVTYVPQVISAADYAAIIGS